MEPFQIKVITNPINQEEFTELLNLEKTTQSFIKLMVDIDKEIIAINCELHCDCGEILTEQYESTPKSLWGANIRPLTKGIEYFSLMNIKVWDQNPSQEIVREDIREKVKNVINKLIFQNY